MLPRVPRPLIRSIQTIDRESSIAALSVTAGGAYLVSRVRELTSSGADTARNSLPVKLAEVASTERSSSQLELASVITTEASIGMMDVPRESFVSRGSSETRAETGYGTLAGGGRRGLSASVRVGLVAEG